MVASDALCYRHPDRPAAVGCQRCDRPICATCMHPASVGFHCPACTKAGAQKSYAPGGSARSTPFTYGVLAIVALVFLAQMATGEIGSATGTVRRDFILWGPDIGLYDEYWRIVTGTFLHGGILHVLLNSYFIYNFGRFLEQGIGWLRTGLIYAGGLFGGSAAVLIFNWSVPTLGASGAALGLGGGAVAIMASRGLSITQSPLSRILVLNLVLPLIIGGISFWGHFGGVLGGAAVGAALSFLPARFGQSQKVALATSGAVIVALAILAAVAGGEGPLV